MPLSFRILKVDRTSPTTDAKTERSRTPSPRVRLQGRWLADCGFEIGDTVKVTAKDERIVVEKVTLGEAC